MWYSADALVNIASLLLYIYNIYHFLFQAPQLSNQTLTHLIRCLVSPYECNGAFYYELGFELSRRNGCGDGAAVYAFTLAERMYLDSTPPPELQYLASHVERFQQAPDFVYYLHICFSDPTEATAHLPKRFSKEERWFITLPSHSPLLPPPPEQAVLRKTSQRKDFAQLYLHRCTLLIVY